MMCSNATWCVLEAEPGLTDCRYHLELPVLNSFEKRDAWATRLRREQKKQADATKKAADGKIAQRGRR